MNRIFPLLRRLACLALALCLLQGLAVPARAATYSKGQIITFGRYEQDGNRSNGPEPIEWIILEVGSDDLLLLSRFGLDCVPFEGFGISSAASDQSTPITWENCTLRKWLNDDFFNTAFTFDETLEMKATYIPSGEYSGTHDPVFLPSIQEMTTYFTLNSERQCRATDYARAEGAWYNKDTGYSGWWLRSPGEGFRRIAGVSNNGYIYYKGDPVGTTDNAVRPMIRIMIPGTRCIHNWLPATTTRPTTCSICGETVGSPVPTEDDIVYYLNASSTYTGDKVSHSVDNLLDGNTATNWTEGVSGYGIGEYVDFLFYDNYKLSQIKINAGNHASWSWYEKNCRPKSITLIFSDGTAQAVTLQDTMSQQIITFATPVVTSSLRLTINSVYPGSAYDDTVISDISFVTTR